MVQRHEQLPISSDSHLDERDEHYSGDMEIAGRIIYHPEVYFIPDPIATNPNSPNYIEDFMSKFNEIRAKKLGIAVPKTIDTASGRTRFIADELYVLDRFGEDGMWEISAMSLSDEKDPSPTTYADLRRERQEAIKRLNTLTPEQVLELKAKAKAKPLSSE